MTRIVHLTLAIVVGGVALMGCGKGEEKNASGPSNAAAPTTNGAGSGVTSPEVGLKAVAESEYKPVEGKFGGRMVRDTLGEPKSFNPVTAGETSTTEYTQRIFQGLTETNAFSGDVKPLLAEKWEVAEDGVTWTFHLRKDVTFNDGTPLTAADVVFTWNELIYDLSRPE